MYKSLLLALVTLISAPAWAEGPATGPSSQGGDASDVAPAGVEKPLEPDRTMPDASEDEPPTDSASPDELDEPKVDADPEKSASPSE